MEAKEYVKAVVKKVQCGSEKRKEIETKMLSDIKTAADNGETVEEIMKRMGKPEDAAKQFNDNLTENDKKTYQRDQRGKRVLSIVVVLALLTLVFVLTLPKNKSLSDSTVFNREQVEKQAKQIITLLDQNDFAAIDALSCEEMQGVLTQETMEEVREQICEDWGDFQSYGKIYDSEAQQEGHSYAVMQIKVIYENTSVNYTLSFDEQMQLAGLYIK